MSIKDNALIVSLKVNKPQMTQKDEKATRDAEQANDAHNAGQFRKDLYPKRLVAPILAVESAARAYIESQTYDWSRGEYVLPMQRFMSFTERIGKYQIEFEQSVTAFLNNWSNVMMMAQQNQGGLFDPSAYPDTTSLKEAFRFRVLYRPITDMTDFRVQCQEDELDALRREVEEATRESMSSLLRSPLERLKKVVAHLNEVTAKTDRAVVNKRTGATEIKAPIFRDSVVDNIIDEINLLHDFAEIMPTDVLSVAKSVVDTVPHAQKLRDDPDARKEVNTKTAELLSVIDDMLDN